MAVTVGTIVLCCIAVYVFVSYSLYDKEQQTVRQLSDTVFAQMGVSERTNLLFGTTVTLSLPELDDFRYSGCYLRIVDAENRVRDKTGDIAFPVFSELQKGFEEPFYREVTIGTYPFLTYSAPIWIGGTGAERYVGAVQVAVLLDDIAQSLASLRTVLVLVVLAGVVLASSIGYFLARQSLAPIEGIIAEAKRIGQDDALHGRIGYAGPRDELGRLTETINAMIARLQAVSSALADAITAQRRFVSDASHELRTPLTTIRGNGEWLAKMWRGNTAHDDGRIRAAIEDIVAEAARMSRLVHEMLQLARSDAGQTLAMRPTMLLPIVEDVARQAAFLPRTAQWIVGDLSALHECVVFANTDGIKQLLFIFIDNAFAYTSEGGTVTLDAARDPERKRVGLCVRDEGIGIPAEHVPHVFERFYRIDDSRGTRQGSGLGLAIAKRIIDAHSGAIDVYTREGMGTTMIAWLPLDNTDATQYDEEEDASTRRSV
jgi:signal transduction histidine kinase